MTIAQSGTEIKVKFQGYQYADISTANNSPTAIAAFAHICSTKSNYTKYELIQNKKHTNLLELK